MIEARLIPRASCCSPRGSSPTAVRGLISSSIRRISSSFASTAVGSCPRRFSFVLSVIPPRKSLALFFDLNTFDLMSERLRFKLIPERLRGEVAAFDIKDQKGKILVEAGRRITARHINQMTKAGLDTLEIVDDYAFGKNLGCDVVDTGTGEIIANANDEVTAELLAKFREHGIETFETLYTNDVDRGPYMSRTLTADQTHSQLEAQVEIYRMMRPGEPPTKEAAQALFHNLFFQHGAIRSLPGGTDEVQSPRGSRQRDRHGILYDSKYLSARNDALSKSLTAELGEGSDIVAVLKTIVDIKNGIGMVDDIDHLGNRRIRSVGEMGRTSSVSVW